MPKVRRRSADRSSIGFHPDYISEEAMGSDEVLMELDFAIRPIAETPRVMVDARRFDMAFRAAPLKKAGQRRED